MYTDDKNAQITLALLKKYGIKKIVISPGMINAPISRSVQIDDWFEVYSVVDERSAAYFATGLAYESGEPVVISCTGATASRNYLPGLTEAYYRKLPVIALTSQPYASDAGDLVPQFIDRSVSQNDIKKISVHLPAVKDNRDAERCVIFVNKALIHATVRGGGPVHINLQGPKFSFTTPELPDVRKIDYFNSETVVEDAKKLKGELLGKKIAVFIGAHAKFNARLKAALKKFASVYNAAVIVDQTSGYRADNSILLSQIAGLRKSANLPDIIIDMGSVTGDYNIKWLRGVEAWRLSEDGEIHDRFQNQTKLFDCSEALFFETLAGGITKNKTNYHGQLNKELDNIVVPDLPLSNTLVSYELSRRLPKGSNLHLGILNSLRNMNFFRLDESIDSISNVGGFGIDGPLSTLIGQSMVDPKKLTFGLVGDLAAFYDMNALGIRHIGNNIRILMVNNNGGVEFRLNETLETQFAEATNDYISARGHHGSMKAWAEDMGFHYISASAKEEFMAEIDAFCSPQVDKFGKPVFFEVFTKIPDEQLGISVMHDANAPTSATKVVTESKLKSKLKKATPELAKKVYRRIKRG